MRYLKNFNESIQEFVGYNELIEFCEIHLANLIDNGFTLKLKRKEDYKAAHYMKEEVMFVLTKDTGVFKWSDIRDYFLPFFEILVDDYNLDKMTNKGDNIKFIDTVSYLQYNIEEILNDTIEESPELTKILFIIKNKK